MPTFNVQKGYDKLTEFKVKPGSMVIGRDPSCDFMIDTGEVSRRHVKVTMKDDNKVFIEDLNSSNGTFVNYSPIEGQHELKHMDVVQIGGNMFVFNNMDLPSEAEQLSTKPGFKTQEYYSFAFMGITISKIEDNIKKVFKGKPEVIRNVIICLLSDGHLLIEDVPGVGKSMLAQALAKSIHGVYRRIQFTPDMMPSDITGINVYDDKTKEFAFVPGPIFGNVILADEINRTTPRTQASLLECMSESVVTVDGKPHLLQKPFYVIATQNPSDYHGTYPLPEPQLDRFLMRISIGYPQKSEEMEILCSQAKKHPLNEITHVVKSTEILQCHALVKQIHVSDSVREYILNVAAATRAHPALETGCSPRASLALMRASQCLAAYNGREYVIPKDVRDLVQPVLGHRVSLKLRAQGEWGGTAEVLASVLEKIPLEDEDVTAKDKDKK